MSGFHKLPEGVLEFVQENAPGRSNQDLASMTNATFGTDFTQSTMKGYKNYHKIRSGIKPKPPSPFTHEMREFIFANSDGITYTQMTQMVNDRFKTDFPSSKLRWFYQNNKIKCGVTVIVNSKPVGSVVTDKDGYLRRKTESGKWELLHRLIWEEAHGQIPAGCKVTFLDGNKENAYLDNLVLVTNAEQMIMAKDGLRFEDPQLTKTGILIAKVKIATKERQKGGGNHGK